MDPLVDRLRVRMSRGILPVGLVMAQLSLAATDAAHAQDVAHPQEVARVQAAVEAHPGSSKYQAYLAWLTRIVAHEAIRG
jgi:hypothetical protein